MSLKGDRDKDRATENTLNNHMQISDALGQTELNRYNNDALSPGQQRWQDEAKVASDERIDEYAKQTGASAKDLKATAGISAMLVKESMHENTLTKAITAFGYSLDEAQQLAALHQKQHAEATAAFSSVLSIVGTIVGAWFGPAGAAAGAAAGKGLGSEVG